MFKVRNKFTGEIHTVYAFAGAMFLIYDGVWRWTLMEIYEPVEG